MQEREKRDVLILDQETRTLMKLFDRIYGEGFETTGVSTPLEALSWVARRKPDILVDHLHGNTLDERGLLEKVREVSPGTHIILLGDQEAPQPGFDHDLLEGQIDWVPRDPEDIALLEAINRAAGEEASPSPMAAPPHA